MADGWFAKLDLGFECRAGRTVLASGRRHGPLCVQRPFYPEGDACHLYLLHPPGGVVGGDRLELDARVGERAHALLTTPGATKFYRSTGAQAVQQQRLRIEAGGVLEWFPQENILFPGAEVRSHTRLELTGDARLLGWEIQVLGRPVIGERFRSGTADLGLLITRDGRPLLSERLRLAQGDALEGPSGLRGYPVVGAFFATGAQTEDLAVGRETLTPPEHVLFAITRLDDLLVARCLARAIEPVRRTFTALWGLLRPRLVGRAACPPRIWAT
ncbi:MAG: urease accessory protein UreD [Candidatus Thiosymbion ectosymbiont of Robbea hypermnestra]|nr:urease accessory protein UreD [Candidatus Thiosymbion ectosymbiont of Robbea hypermnestra]